MAVTTPPPPRVEIDDGVIEEARRRQRRRRRGAVALLALSAITAVTLAVAFDGGRAASRRPLSPYGPLKLTFVDGRPYLNGQLFPIVIGPALDAQAVSLNIVPGSRAGAYAERGMPLFGWGELSGPPARVGGELQCSRFLLFRGPHLVRTRRQCIRTSAPVGPGGEVDYFLTEPQVAAVRVPGIGTLKPAALPGLPSGIRIVVFYRPPGSHGTVLPPDPKDSGLEHGLPMIIPVPLDAHGRPIPTTEPSSSESRSTPSSGKAAPPRRQVAAARSTQPLRAHASSSVRW